MEMPQSLGRIDDSNLTNECNIRRAQLLKTIEVILSSHIPHVGAKDLTILETIDEIIFSPRIQVKPRYSVVQLLSGGGHSSILGPLGIRVQLVLFRKSENARSPLALRIQF